MVSIFSWPQCVKGGEEEMDRYRDIFSLFINFYEELNEVQCHKIDIKLYLKLKMFIVHLVLYEIFLKSIPANLCIVKWDSHVNVRHYSISIPLQSLRSVLSHELLDMIYLSSISHCEL